jgi:hypothetical protein
MGTPFQIHSRNLTEKIVFVQLALLWNPKVHFRDPKSPTQITFLCLYNLCLKFSGMFTKIFLPLDLILIGFVVNVSINVNIT